MSVDFSDLASAIWYDIGQPTALTQDAIQTRLQSNFFIGKLNNLIDTCFSFDTSGNILVNKVPDTEDAFGSEEQNIYIELYKNNYYAQRIAENLGAGGIAWTSLKEGDSTVNKVSPTEIAKTYQTLKNNSDEVLRTLVNSYLNNKTRPYSSDFYDIDLR